MVLAVEQYKTLEQMGIPVWELRSQSADIDSETQTIETVDLSYSSHVVICDMPQQGSEEYHLLVAILASISAPFDQVAYLSERQAMSHQVEMSHKTVIGFADSDLKLDIQLIHLPALKTQLKQPQLKAVVWSTLVESLEP